MKKIAFIIPYFGKLPNFFNIWLITANSNPTIDFFIFTDVDKSRFNNVCENIKIFNITFEELKERIQRLYNFKISLNSPYKLCDFKPAYGEIFSDILKEYDFWGHCDIDMIFGDIRNFMTEDILNKYEKIQTCGFFSLYKNIKKVNELYKYQGKYPDLNYQYVFQSNDSFYFDEYRGMYAKTICANIKLYNKHIHRNPKQSEFLFYEWNISPETQFVLEWNAGKLYSISVLNGKKEEICFAHFFRRNMNIENIENTENIDKIAIIPNRIIIGRKICKDDFKIKNKKLYKFKYMLNKIKRNKYTLIKFLKRKKWEKDSDLYNQRLSSKKDV